MQYEPRQSIRPEQIHRVTPRLITASNILHFSADELEHAITQEQIENPAIEVKEERVCQFCGAKLYGMNCTACGHTFQATAKISDAIASYESPEPQWDYRQQTFYDIDNSGFAEVDNDDGYDPLAHIPSGDTLVQALLPQLEALVALEDEAIAEQLVGNLNERGYLEISTEEIANYLEVSVERVEHVLSKLHTLEPLGIGARDLRECLLIQLHSLEVQENPPPLVYTLVEHHILELGRTPQAEFARKLNAKEEEVNEAVRFIRTMLHPSPAYMYNDDVKYTQVVGGVTYVRPDVVIRANEDNNYEIELIEEKRYDFRVNKSYEGTNDNDAEVQKYMHLQSDRAKSFVDFVHRRWHTLRRIMEFVIDYQQNFLLRGIRHLRPLTRAEVAARLDLDEGTVSRATANKYALLPNGQLIPLSNFFDGSLSIKDALRELILFENAKHRLSDDELARRLSAQGMPMARRTVTKYREEMGIGSSRERG